jgi:hypothetical protein
LAETLVAINRPKKKTEESPRRKEEEKMQKKNDVTNAELRNVYFVDQSM